MIALASNSIILEHFQSENTPTPNLICFNTTLMSRLDQCVIKQMSSTRLVFTKHPKQTCGIELLLLARLTEKCSNIGGSFMVIFFVKNKSISESIQKCCMCSINSIRLHLVITENKFDLSSVYKTEPKGNYV